MARAFEREIPIYGLLFETPDPYRGSDHVSSVLTGKWHMECTTKELLQKALDALVIKIRHDLGKLLWYYIDKFVSSKATAAYSA